MLYSTLYSMYRALKTPCITFARFESATIKRIRLYNVPIFGRGTKTCLSFESWVIWRRSFFIVEDPNPNIDAKFGSQLAKCSFRIRNKLIFNSVHGIFCKITSEKWKSFFERAWFESVCPDRDRHQNNPDLQHCISQYGQNLNVRVFSCTTTTYCTSSEKFR